MESKIRTDLDHLLQANVSLIQLVWETWCESTCLGTFEGPMLPALLSHRFGIHLGFTRIPPRLEVESVESGCIWRRKRTSVECPYDYGHEVLLLLLLLIFLAMN